MSERNRANLRKGNIGFVFQSFNLIDELTVYENVELPLLYLKTPRHGAQKEGGGSTRTHEHHASPQPLSTAIIRWSTTACGHRPGRGSRTQSHPRRRTDR